MPAKQRGFTLIEILIVITIIGITLSFALLAFGDFGKTRQAITAAEQLATYIKLVQQQAILQTNAFAIKVSNKGYGTYFLMNGSKWQPMPNKAIFGWRNFPSNLVVNKESDIFIDATGSIAEFKLDFGTTKKISVASLSVKPNGILLLHKYPTRT